jgi:hypothetical protein
LGVRTKTGVDYSIVDDGAAYTPIFNNRGQPIIRAGAWPPQAEVDSVDVVTPVAFFAAVAAIASTLPPPAPPSDAQGRRAIVRAEATAYEKLLKEFRSTKPRSVPLRRPAAAARPQQAPPVPPPAQEVPASQIAGDDEEDLFAGLAEPVGLDRDAAQLEDDEDDDEPADFADRFDRLAAPPVSADVLSAFRRGHGTCPPVALLLGADLVRWLKLPSTQLAQTADMGVEPETRDSHRRCLRYLARMPPTFQAMQLSVAIAEWLRELKRTSPWMESTLLKYMASTMGALAALPLYREGTLPLTLQVCPAWRAALRGCVRKTRLEVPRQPKAATRRAVELALARETSLPVRVAISLAWAFAGRVGDILNLMTDDVRITPEGSVTATYRRHKTFATKGPWTVHSAPLQHSEAAAFRSWLNQRTEQRFLFPMYSAGRTSMGVAVRTALRRADPQLEQRSLRRGSLLAMATSGVPEAVLLEFSGHASTKMLRRYLQWGAALRVNSEAMATAGAVLVQQA